MLSLYQNGILQCPSTLAIRLFKVCNANRAAIARMASTSPTGIVGAVDRKIEASDDRPPELVNGNDAPPSRGRQILNIIYWVPPRCRWNTTHPPKFTIWHNILFAFAGAFTVANLYYNHPILNILAKEFDTSQTGVSRVPTMMQAGYAVGMFFILPIGDFVPIRRLTLTCILFTAVMW